MNVRLRHDMHFTAGVYYGGQTRMNNYTLTLWMTTNCLDPADQNTAFERIKYFVYSEIDSTIFINAEHETQCQLLSAAGLNITTMPGEPVDQLIGIMLYYKLNAITEGRMIIEETELASTMGENMTYLHASNEHTNIATQPDWWQATDLIHCDLSLIDTDKVLTMPQATVWRDLDLSWTLPETVSDVGNTVVFADFKKFDDPK
jgi:hypothetical protein